MIIGDVAPDATSILCLDVRGGTGIITAVFDVVSVFDMFALQNVWLHVMY